MKKVCKELIDFFEHEEGWDKNEILSEWAGAVLRKLNCTMQPDNIPISMDEIVLHWGEDELPVTLQDFASELFGEMIKGVCNVIRTA